MIHTFNRAGYNIALDAGSGAVHVLDDAAYGLLNNLSADEIAANKPNNQLTAAQLTALGELHELYKNGTLYSDDSYDEFKGKTGLAPVKAMCLHISHDCNLRCRYCFAATGDFGTGRKNMPFEVAKKAVDMLCELSENRHNIEIDFFGGEPLINFDVVKQTVAYCRSIEEAKNKNFRFTITTNGVLLDSENIAYINENMQNVVLSLDGRKHVNDEIRTNVAGGGSYDVIVPKFKQLVDARGDKEYYIRGTYTKYNLDFYKDVLHISELGFDQISVEPVVGPEQDDYAINMAHLKEAENSYTTLMDDMLARSKASGAKRYNFFHFMVDLDQGPCAIKRLRGCGSGNEYVSITPDGEIFPCHQFVGKHEFLMGHVDSGIVKPELKEQFANANIYSKPKCMECWAKYYCSGGCNANNYAYEGSLLEPHKVSCELEKIRLECAVALKVATLLSKN